jgi:hypothetical protein
MPPEENYATGFVNCFLQAFRTTVMFPIDNHPMGEYQATGCVMGCGAPVGARLQKQRCDWKRR